MQTITLPSPDIPAQAQAALRRTESPLACAFLRWALDALDHGVALDPAQQARIRALYEATNQAAGGPSP